MGGWLDLTQRGLSLLKKRQAKLGAPTTWSSPAAPLIPRMKLEKTLSTNETGDKRTLDRALGWNDLLGSPEL